MSGDSTDDGKKSGTGDPGAHVNLKVKGQDGIEVFFRIKRSTKLKKLMTAYCDRQSVDFDSVAFLFDGRRINGEQTSHELEMEDGDEIGAVFQEIEEQRVYCDESVTENSATEGERIRRRKNEEDASMKIGKMVYILASQLVVEDIGVKEALKDELTRLRKDGEEGDAVFIRFGEIVFGLVKQEMAENVTLKEEVERLMEEVKRLLKIKDEEKEEDKDDDGDDVFLINIGRIVSGLVAENVTLNEELTRLKEVLTRLWKDEKNEEEESDALLLIKIGEIVRGLFT